jgi:hypothetical protein
MLNKVKHLIANQSETLIPQRGSGASLNMTMNIIGSGEYINCLGRADV